MTFLWIENDSQFFSFLIHRFHSIWLNMIWFDSIDWIKYQAHHHHHRSCYRCRCQSIIDDWARFNYNQTHGMWCFFLLLTAIVLHIDDDYVESHRHYHCVFIVWPHHANYHHWSTQKRLINCYRCWCWWWCRMDKWMLSFRQNVSNFFSQLKM